MKILGFYIGRQPIEDKVTVRSVVTHTIPIAKIPRVKPGSLNYSQAFAGGGRTQFRAGEYDLAEIGKIEDTDSYVRQAFKKKLGLMLKEGLDLSGANKDTLQYVKERLAQISRASVRASSSS